MMFLCQSSGTICESVSCFLSLLASDTTQFLLRDLVRVVWLEFLKIRETPIRGMKLQE